MVKANYINKINKQIIFAVALVIVLLSLMVEVNNLKNYTTLLQNIKISTKKIEAYSFKPEVFQYNKFKLVFGENYELDNKAIKQQSDKELPVAKRDLVLKGILSRLGAGNKNLGSVIISFKGQTKIYFIGDHIPGGGYLYGINNDHIIIKTNNNLEKLCLQDKLSLTP